MGKAKSVWQLTILYQDDDVVAVDKPAGLAAVSGRGETECVRSLLSGQLGVNLLPVHRLDKDTSGVMLWARNPSAQRHLSHQFQNNEVEKEYLALVAGRPQTDRGQIDAAIGAHPACPRRMAVVRHGGRPARTLWQVEQRFRDFTLLRVFPKTRKTHQIRVHLAHAGMPLAVDPLYNPPGGGIFLSSIKRGYRSKLNQPERPLIARLTLHAHRLHFKHPDGRQITVEAPLPRDFRAVVNQLRRVG